MYKITRENLPALYRALAAERELYLPVRKSGQVNFAAWDEAWSEEERNALYLHEGR